MLRAFASGRLFGERFGAEPPWVLALHGWARSHADFAGVLSGNGTEGPAPGTEGPAPGTEGPAPGTEGPAPGTEGPAPGTEGPAPGTEGPAPGTEGPALDAIALDLPGFGAAPAPEHPWGAARYSEAIAEVLDEMAPKVVVLGHSFGGRVAVNLAVQHPERVAALVLTGVPLYRPEGSRSRPVVQYRLVRGLARAGLVGEGRLERARQRYGSSDYRAAQGVMRGVLVTAVAETHESYETVLAQIACPALLVWGDQDDQAPVQVARRAAAAIDGAGLEILPGVGHMTPLTAPTALRDAVVRLRP